MGDVRENVFAKAHESGMEAVLTHASIKWNVGKIRQSPAAECGAVTQIPVDGITPAKATRTGR